MLTFREATEEDLPALLDLLHELTPEEARLSDAQARETFQRSLRYPSYRHHLAFDGTDCVGAFALLIVENLGHHGAPFAVIENIVVTGARRREGIGREMLKHALDLSRRAGCYKLSLSTNLKRTGAHVFYEHLGFERHGYSFVASL